ncbi:MAG TPA: DNA gyrase subunit A [Candidatus Bipolaricaulota bacterium]|nr:DNA gyrase subunit A [Candidatus Bipolaricaulota bacterium]
MPKKDMKIKPVDEGGQSEPVAGKLIPQSLVEEMQKCYLDYAMSVIVSRALPDVRDGLKPVHRRILYAMWTLGLKYSGKFRKSATVVGEVLGKYHPHGDVAVYESMVRLAQYFSMRYTLVKGQGNFGSMDGDRAAAMRYTEAKLDAVAEELLFDIDKETVEFVPNYDGTQKEPLVLPAKLPNLLLNGMMGIAVGMATNIPPHNLTELCNGLVYLIENPDAYVEDLIKFIPGPDFPTGGLIFDSSEIKQAYATGRGKIVMRAKTEIVEEKSGQFRILVTEMPFQVNKATLLEKIADLVKDKKLEGIKDLRDESSKEGVRIVIELKKDTYPKKILNRLFQLTQLQSAFNVNMLALVDGIQPKVLTLKDILGEYLSHRRIVIRKRTEFELRKAEDRAHILEGLKIALDNIDAVIKLIKQSKDKEEAKIGLIKKFKLSERQAIAILEMRLQNLANLESLRVLEELKEKMALIKELKAILSSDKRISGIIKDELLEIKEKYGDERRTQIVPGGVGEFAQEDLVPNESTIVVITRDGYIKRVPPETFKSQKRGGKGVIGLATKEEDVVEQFFTTMTHNNLLFFTTRGRVFQLKSYDVPPSARTTKGQAIVNFLQLAPQEKISSVLVMEKLASTKYLMMVTKKGLIKKTPLSDFANVRRSGLIAIKLKDEDRLKWVKPTSGADQVFLVTSNGQSIRFDEKNVRAMGRSAAGVRGIRLKGEDKVIGMDVMDAKLSAGYELMVATELGYGKRTSIKQYKVQNRGGSGIRTAKVTSKNGKAIFGKVVDPKDRKERDIIIISQKGQVIRIPFTSIPSLGRDTQGVRIMRFKAAGDSVANIAFVQMPIEEK